MDTNMNTYLQVAMAGPLVGEPLPWPSLRRRRRRRFALRG
jgi:hypothetical protein